MNVLYVIGTSATELLSLCISLRPSCALSGTKSSTNWTSPWISGTDLEYNCTAGPWEVYARSLYAPYLRGSGTMRCTIGGRKRCPVLMHGTIGGRKRCPVLMHGTIGGRIREGIAS
eukprot:144035-Rhodomonas_salina.1